MKIGFNISECFGKVESRRECFDMRQFHSIVNFFSQPQFFVIEMNHFNTSVEMTLFSKLESFQEKSSFPNRIVKSVLNCYPHLRTFYTLNSLADRSYIYEWQFTLRDYNYKKQPYDPNIARSFFNCHKNIYLMSHRHIKFNE